MSSIDPIDQLFEEQEYSLSYDDGECDHEWEEVAVPGNTIAYRCEICGERTD